MTQDGPALEPSTDPVPRLENEHLISGTGEVASSRQARKAGSDDDDLHAVRTPSRARPAAASQRRQRDRTRGGRSSERTTTRLARVSQAAAWVHASVGSTPSVNQLRSSSSRSSPTPWNAAGSRT